MPINTKHPEYKENEHLWEFCEDFYKGSAAVKNKGQKYLPALSGQTTSKYQSYKERALVPGFVPRTVSVLVGAIFRKEPHFALPEKLQYLLTDATGRGESLLQLVVKIVTEVMTTGRAVLVADMPIEGGKPYITFYDADDLINWSDIKGSEFRVLEDCLLVPSTKDKFTLVEEEGYRELLIEEGIYKVNIWRKKNGKRDEFSVAETIIPEKSGKPLTYLPLVCINPSDIGFNVSKPPILELCEVAQTSYRVGADWYNALHVAACPTPVISADGIDADKFVLNLGPDTYLLLPSGGKAEFLESKTELAALESAIKKLEELAAILGARLLDTSKSSQIADTATSAMIKESASTAILSSIITAVELALTQCLMWIADWEHSDPFEVEVSLNKELVQAKVDANMLTALVNALQTGTISQETFYHNLLEGGLTEPGISVEDEVKRISEKVNVNNELNKVKENNKPIT